MRISCSGWWNLGLTMACLSLSPVATGAQQHRAPRADTLNLYYEFQVEDPVHRLAWPKPQYPDSLRAARVDGEVVVEFVVDTSGRMEAQTLRVTRSTHPAFSRAVLASATGARFAPARIAGRPVRQVVQQTFVFSPPS